jgi:hypothetical protein
MGPISLFDKSFLQSLSLDESVWFDHFFLSNISPLFFIETLADLEKRKKIKRTSLEEVRIIAEKTPQMNCAPCEFHNNLYVNNLLGYEIPMTGQIPIAEAQIVMYEGQPHAISKDSSVATAFLRWQKGEFTNVEKNFAREWQKSLLTLDLSKMSPVYSAFGINPKSFKSLENIRDSVKELITTSSSRELSLLIAFATSLYPENIKARILSNWRMKGTPPLHIYAPYAAYVLLIEIFFSVALSAQLISTKRSSNAVDISYLFYLPFCMIFISSDRLHKRLAPLFLRDDQEFVWGIDLKNALTDINTYFSALPEGEKEKGIHKIANRPPATRGTIIDGLWRRHLPKLYEENKSVLSNNESFAEIRKKVKEIEKLPPLQNTNSIKSNEVQSMTFTRKVTRKRGSWYQVPKNHEVKEM